MATASDFQFISTRDFYVIMKDMLDYLEKDNSTDVWEKNLLEKYMEKRVFRGSLQARCTFEKINEKLLVPHNKGEMAIILRMLFGANFFEDLEKNAVEAGKDKEEYFKDAFIESFTNIFGIKFGIEVKVPHNFDEYADLLLSCFDLSICQQAPQNVRDVYYVPVKLLRTFIENAYVKRVNNIYNNSFIAGALKKYIEGYEKHQRIVLTEEEKTNFVKALNTLKSMFSETPVDENGMDVTLVDDLEKEVIENPNIEAKPIPFGQAYLYMIDGYNETLEKEQFDKMQAKADNKYKKELKKEKFKEERKRKEKELKLQQSRTILEALKDDSFDDKLLKKMGLLSKFKNVDKYLDFFASTYADPDYDPVSSMVISVRNMINSKDMFDATFKRVNAKNSNSKNDEKSGRDFYYSIVDTIDYDLFHKNGKCVEWEAEAKNLYIYIKNAALYVARLIQTPLDKLENDMFLPFDVPHFKEIQNYMELIMKNIVDVCPEYLDYYTLIMLHYADSFKIAKEEAKGLK